MEEPKENLTIGDAIMRIYNDINAFIAKHLTWFMPLFLLGKLIEYLTQK